MSKLTKDDVKHIAKLCRLTIREEDLERFAKELSEILSYIEMLSEVDTSDIEPMENVTGLKNCTREDKVYDNPIDGEEILKTSPLALTERQIQTPSAHG